MITMLCYSEIKQNSKKSFICLRFFHIPNIGGVTEGLVDYYIGPHDPQWHRAHAAAIDFSQSAHAQIFKMAVEALQVRDLVNDVYFDCYKIMLICYLFNKV